MAPKKDAVDEDPVTAEYDVFITPELQEQLFLLQHLTRHREQPYNEACRNKPVDLRMKPRSGFVELDVPINATYNYDTRKARIWSNALAKSKADGMTGHGIAAGFANNPGGRNQPPPNLERAALEDLSEDEDHEGVVSQTMGGQIAYHTRGKPMYMIGTFRGAELHLTKLDGVVQLRSQFHHMDAMTQVERSKSRREREIIEPPKHSEPRIVQQTAKPTYDQGFDVSDTKEILQAAHEERWTRLKYRDEEEEVAYRQYGDKLFFPNPKKAPKLTASMDNEAYLESISAPRLDSKGRPRVKPLTKKQKIQIGLADADGSDAEQGVQQ